MSEKLYSPTYSSMFDNQPGAKQNQINDQTYFQYTNTPINNTLVLPNNMDMYNPAPPQNFPRIQNNCPSVGNFQDSMDFMNWDNRISEKLPEKIDILEITSKDLSPASYCSNIDLLVPDCYKSTKEVNYYNNPWYCNANYCQKSLDLPSCAQVSRNNVELHETSKYCSIQKTQDLEMVINNCSYNNDFIADNSEGFYKNASLKSTNDKVQDFSGFNSCYTENQYFPNNLGNTNISFDPIDQQTECSNDESDIIVEESDEEITDYSEEHDKKIYYHMNKCIVCNTTYTPLGRQFYFLTSESPLTMSSQKPVFTKIVELVGKVTNDRNYLCSECLGLINSIDHLQLKLNNFNNELITKFKSTCTQNNIQIEDNTILPKVRRPKRFFIKNLPKYKCKLCKKILCLKKYCHYHLKKHKFNGFLCELCGKIFSSKKKFRVHTLKTHKSREKSVKINAFKCTGCSKIFRTKSNLVEHENYCLGILPYACKNQYCDKKFASATKLKNHVKLKHDKKFIAICSICNIGFVKVSDYKSHMITHSTDKKFSCKKCGKSYKTLSNLNFHMKVHSDQMPFICSICKKGFMRKEYLEAHVNNHNGIKNFVCSICEKKFVSQKNLDSHLKYHEGSVKKNTCNVCGKTMTTGFEEHLRIHNNLREFECDQCNLKFNTKGSLSKHIKNKHNVKKSPGNSIKNV